MSQDGPGPQNAHFDSCGFLSFWRKAKTANDLEALKCVQLIGDDDDTNGMFVVTPFSSQPAYTDLYYSFRQLCRASRKERKISAKGVAGEKDFFPDIDAMYDKVLSFFDVAIDQLSKEIGPVTSPPEPSMPTPIIQPSTKHADTIGPPPSLSHPPVPVPSAVSVAFIAPTVQQPVRRTQPVCAKRFRAEDGSSGVRNNKRAKVAPAAPRPRGLSSKSRVPKAKPKAKSTCFGTRRSERLREKGAVVVSKLQM